MFPSDFKLPPNVVDAMKFNDFLIYTVQDPYQYTTPSKEPTYTAYGVRFQDNKSFKVGGPAEKGFYPHRSLVVLVHAMRLAQEAPPLPILTIPVPDYDGFKLTVSRVPNIGEQLFVGKAEKNGMVIEDQHAEAERLVINLRLKIDRYEALFTTLRGINQTWEATKNINYRKMSEDETLSRQLNQQMAEAESPGPLIQLAVLDEFEKDLKKFEARSKEKKSQRDEKGRYSKSDSNVSGAV